jgi:transcription elongation GreA/GreB family factor
MRKIESIGFSIKELDEALEQEVKSTVGDKHETARAKLQTEQASLGWQMDELKGLYRELERVNIKRTFEQIDYGSLIETDHNTFYLTIPLGKVDVEGKTIFVISQFSPIGQKLMGLKTNDEFNFNGTSYRIRSIS